MLALASSYDVEMPLTEAVHRVCHKGLSVDEAVALLLAAAPNRSDQVIDGYGDSTRAVKAVSSEVIPGHPVGAAPVPPRPSISADEGSEADTYGRSSNPSWRQLESALAQLEGATTALSFGSGMAAITAALRAVLRTGSVVGTC